MTLEGKLKKTLVWRAISVSFSLVSGRIWFGDWHVTWFTVFLTVALTIIYYIFEVLWK